MYYLLKKDLLTLCQKEGLCDSLFLKELYRLIFDEYNLGEISENEKLEIIESSESETLLQFIETDDLIEELIKRISNSIWKIHPGDYASN